MTPALCVAAHRDDPDRPRSAVSGLLLCPACLARLEQLVAELPARVDLLHAMLGHAGTASGGGRRPKPSSRPPLSVDRHDLTEHLHGLVGSWTLLVAEERGLHGPDRVTVHSGSRWLLPQVGWCAAQPWVDDLLDELIEVSRQVDGLTRWRRGWHRLPAPCPSCDGQSLGRWDGDDHVTCADCGEVWPEDRYGLLVAMLVDGCSLTAAAAAERSGVDPSTFRGWAAAGELRAIGKSDGASRYAVADVDRVAESKRPREQSA